MISFESQVYFNEKHRDTQACRCGKPSHQVDVVKTVGLFSLPLLVTSRKEAYQCFSCFRLTPTDYQSSNKTAGLTRLMWGWLVTLMFIFSAYTTWNLLYPNDSAYRIAPQIGDTLIVNLYEFTNDSRYLGHPYALAKVSEVSDDGNLTLKVSQWQFFKEIEAIKDVITKKDMLASYYSGLNMSLPNEQLANHDVVTSVRRRHSDFDLESVQRAIFFETKVRSYPNAN